MDAETHSPHPAVHRISTREDAMTPPTHDQIEVFLGVDVGKGHHHAVALSRSGATLFDRTLPNDEARIRELINTLM